MSDDEFDDLDSNDDVFRKTSEDGETSYDPVVNKGFAGGHVLNIDPNNAPGYLVDALTRYVTSFTHGAQQKIPAASPVFKKIVDSTTKFYHGDQTQAASQAVFNVLDRITGGEVKIEYYKLLLEESVVGYASLARYVNSFYAELEKYIEGEEDEEGARCAKALFTYHDILQFHVDYYLYRYQTFCETNSLEANESIISKQAFGEKGPYTVYNFLAQNEDTEYGDNEKEKETRRSVRNFYDSIMGSSAKFIRSYFQAWKSST